MVQRSLKGGRAFCLPTLLPRLSRSHTIRTALCPELETAGRQSKSAGTFHSSGRPSFRFDPNLSPVPLNTKT